MIRRFHSVAPGARDRAADRLMRRHAQPHDPAPLESPEPEDADLEAEMLAMERVWALTGAVALDSRIAEAREADLERFRPATRLRKIGKIGLVAAMLVLALSGIVALQLIDHDRARGVSGQVAMHSFTTGLGQRTHVTLADSSNVTIDTDSEIAVEIGDRLRSVVLKHGRAYFQVAKDRSRPFVVIAGTKRVRATGTAFSVELEDGNVTVTVTEGTVAVTESVGPRAAGPVHTAELDSGNQLVTDHDRDWTIARVDPKRSTSWRTGRLEFIGEPLAAAVAEMNRYTPRKLVFRGGVIPDETIVGVFEAGDVSSLAQALELSGFVRITETAADHIEVEATRP